MRRQLLAALAAGAAVLAAPSGASAQQCPDQSASPVFLPWADVADYVLVPGGDAESADGWAFSGGAGVRAGNEPWSVTGSGSAHVEIPAGARATTPVQCVTIEHPTVRFFARSSQAGPLSALKVEVVAGALTLPIGAVTPSSSWTPTLPFAVVANVLSVLIGDAIPVRFRFTPIGSGSWSVDDVHVDPYRGGGG